MELSELENIAKEIESYCIESLETLEAFRIHYIGSKGLIKGLFKEIKNVSPDERKAFGQKLNGLKNLAEDRYKTLQNSFSQKNKKTSKKTEDWTRPAEEVNLGSRHPVSLVMNQMVEIFRTIGFGISEGPEIEDDWHNFTALNIPKIIQQEIAGHLLSFQRSRFVLRTHTSSVQVRVMEKKTLNSNYFPWSRL